MNAKLRAWWWHRQGLDERLGSRSGQECLSHAGWARTVGSANPYLTVWSRSQTNARALESEVEAVQVHELPSVRGCTYLIPRNDYAVALKVSQGTSEEAAIRQAKKHLGFTDEELAGLNEAVLEALQKGVKDPKELREVLGDTVRNLGEEGKKRGITTTLSLSLGWLQSRGKIRRIPLDKRLDVERFKYGIWTDGPFASGDLDILSARSQLAARYWQWTGGASLAEFRWFTSFGVGDAKAAIANLGLEPIEGDLLANHQDVAAYKGFEPPDTEQIHLLSSLDSLILLRRNLASLMDAQDQDRPLPSGKGMANAGSLADIDSHAIFDRGRLVGLWEFDPDTKEIAYWTLHKPTKGVLSAIERTQSWIRDELGDFRSFSLDSPKSRQPRLQQLRDLQRRDHG